MKTYLKWVGNKTKRISDIYSLLPVYYRDYYEPFCGSAALFLNLFPANFEIYSNKIPSGKCYLSDINSHLINCHLIVAHKLEQLKCVLAEYERNEEQLDFYDIERAKTKNDIKCGEDVVAAARFIYLNRRSYGGMWRENKDGMFNVPKCKSQKASFCSSYFFNILNNCSKLLSKAIIKCMEYNQILPMKDDFVFMDPPYYPFSKNSNFTSYSRGAWTNSDHVNFFHFVNKLNTDGVKFLITNNDCEYVRDKCSDYKMQSFKAVRFIDALKYKNGRVKSEGREVVQELIIWNY